MNSFISRWATPLITGLFVISLVSGIAIFFGLGRGIFMGMHEWLSMALAIPFVMHLWKNWRPFKAYLRKPAMLAAGVLSLAAAAAFAVPGIVAPSGPPPERAMIQLLPSRTIAQLAPLFGHTGQSLQEVFQQKGLVVSSADDTLDEIAQRSATSTSQVLSAALASRH